VEHLKFTISHLIYLKELKSKTIKNKNYVTYNFQIKYNKQRNFKRKTNKRREKRCFICQKTSHIAKCCNINPATKNKNKNTANNVQVKDKTFNNFDDSFFTDNYNSEEGESSNLAMIKDHGRLNNKQN